MPYTPAITITVSGQRISWDGNTPEFRRQIRVSVVGTAIDAENLQVQFRYRGNKVAQVDAPWAAVTTGEYGSEVTTLTATGTLNTTALAIAFAGLSQSRTLPLSVECWDTDSQLRESSGKIPVRNNPGQDGVPDPEELPSSPYATIADVEEIVAGATGAGMPPDEATEIEEDDAFTLWRLVDGVRAARHVLHSTMVAFIQSVAGSGGGSGTKPEEEKETPVDADGVTFWNSAAEWAGAFVSWANIKATLKSYFEATPMNLKANILAFGEYYDVQSSNGTFVVMQQSFLRVSPGMFPGDGLVRSLEAVAGQVLVLLKGDGDVTLVNGENLSLGQNIALSATAPTVLVCDGTNWMPLYSVISEPPEAGTVEATTTFMVWNYGLQYKVTAAQIATFALPAEDIEVPVALADTDTFPVRQVPEGGIPYWVAKTGTQLKAWLKTYFDTLFAALSHKSRHATGGADALSASDIGAESANAVSTHNAAAAAHPFTAANKFRYGGTEGATTEADITAAGRALLDDATAAAQLETLGAQAAASGTALPTGGSIVTGQVFRLTAADNTAKAAPGLYVHDGTGWACQLPFAAYAWGNTGATPTLALITGCPYVLTQDQAISSCAITMSRPGVVVIAKTGLFTFAVPTMAGRTVLPRTSAGWTSAGAASVEIALFDDGTRLWISAVEGVA